MFSIQSIINALNSMISGIRGAVSGINTQKLTAAMGGIPTAGAVPQPQAGGGSVGFAGVSPVGRAVASPGFTVASPTTPVPVSTSVGTFAPSPFSAVSGGVPSPISAPPLAPMPAPTPTPTPPPSTGGGGMPMSAGAGGGAMGAPSPAIPRESPLPPTPSTPSDAIGRYEAMMRSLMQQYGNVGKVPTPLAGATPFGPGSAFGDILRKLQQKVRV